MIRKFNESDAQMVSDLIIRTLRTSNIKDYSVEILDEVAARMMPEDILTQANERHMYVAEEEGKIVGCGAIGSYLEKVDESCLFTIYVLPEYQGKGIGRRIVETLEMDEYALRAKRIEIHASITGLPFYLKLGYTYKNGFAELDDEQLYTLEKYR